MSHILSACHDFNFSESYAYADIVRKAIFNSDYMIDPVDVASDIEAQSVKPRKWTILHDYINYVVSQELRFYFRGGGWEYEDVTPIFAMLKSHQIEFFSLEEYIEDWLYDEDLVEPVKVTEELKDEYKYQYAWEYLEYLVTDKLQPILVTEVFSLLFADREAMRVFNLKVAEGMAVRSARFSRWPKWLERALFCREKGLCAICKSDLTSMFHTHGKLAIDHIVPIALNGVNDPTNLQVLCQSCNSKKGGTKVVTSNTMPVFWKV